MIQDPWGVDTPPAVPAELPPLPPRLAALADLEARGERRFLAADEGYSFPRAAELPEVQALGGEGWRPAPDDSVSNCLPAVWPAQHRCWVPDRLPRISHASGGGRQWLQPWDEDDRSSSESWLAEAAAECGLPDPPTGRLWLLRSPWPTLGLRVVRGLIGRLRHERGLDEGFVGTTQAADWASATNTHGGDAVEAILSWREVGMPADPPTDRFMVLMSLTAAEFGDWQAAGFTFDDVATWLAAPLELAIRWREGGFTPAQAQSLLQADWAVTPDEAVAFDDAGVDPRARPHWLALGFTAGEARAWTDLDVFPQEARVWRALGRGVEDARNQLATGGGPLPPDLNVGWVGFGSGRAQRVYGVTDPPGTRGSDARKAEHRPRR